MRLLHEERPDVYVDGDLLPPYMGVCIQPVDDFDVVNVLAEPTTIRIAPRYETYLTKLITRNGMPYKYIRVCRLIGVEIRVVYEDRVLHYCA